MDQEMVLQKKLLSMAEFARICGIGRSRAAALRKAGLLKCIRFDGYKVTPKELERFLSWAEGKDLSDPYHVKDIE